MNNEIRFRVALDGAQQVKSGADGVADSFKRVGRDAKQVADESAGLVDVFRAAGDGIRSLAQVAAIGTMIGGFVRTADAVTVLNNQLRLAVGSAESAKQAYGALFDIAQRSRTSFTELGATFASIARATGELGISQGRLLRITEAIGNSLAISGGSAQGMQAALTQLGQGFASGALRGEELNSVLEQTPRLAKAIADGMGVSVGKLRELGQAGKLTAAAVLAAGSLGVSSLASAAPFTQGSFAFSGSTTPSAAPPSTSAAAAQSWRATSTRRAQSHAPPCSTSFAAWWTTRFRSTRVA